MNPDSQIVTCSLAPVHKLYAFSPMAASPFHGQLTIQLFADINQFYHTCQDTSRSELELRDMKGGSEICMDVPTTKNTMMEHCLNHHGNIGGFV